MQPQDQRLQSWLAMLLSKAVAECTSLLNLAALWLQLPCSKGLWQDEWQPAVSARHTTLIPEKLCTEGKGVTAPGSAPRSLLSGKLAPEASSGPSLRQRPATGRPSP